MADSSAGLKREEAFVRALEREFPEVRFKWGAKRFSCRLMNGKFTVFLGQPCPNFGLLTLHELGHALCKHKDYTTDVQRLKIEAEAWERGKEVLLKMQEKDFWTPEWDEDFAQDHLDTYRDWLHTKSKCKKCGLTRYQTADGEYHCLKCENFAG